MGEQADYLIEQGLWELALHKGGLCDTEDPCPYCHEEYEKAHRVETETTEKPK